MASPSRANGRVRLSAAERYQQLLHAAREAYLDLGIDRASVHQVAKFAGVNVATIYQHFPSAAELFYQAVLVPLDASVDEHLEAGTQRMRNSETEDRAAALHASLLELMLDIGPTVNAVVFSEHEVGRRYVHETIRPRIDAWLVEALHGIGYHNAALRRSTASTLLGTYLWLSMHSSYRGEDLVADGWALRIASFVDGGITLASQPDAS
jgi:AcrR family transcriptional regulator